jgi:outer membrane protein W
VGGDIAIRVVDPVDIVLGFAYASTSKSSEFREFVDQDDLPITQRTTFSHVPLTAALKVYLTPRGREIGRFAWVPARLSPYVGAGGGMMHYSFRQVGSFVDYQDLSIFDETFESDGWTPLAMVMAGLDFSISPRVVLNTDARYHWASAELNQDFIDFADGIDLSGIQLSLGFLFRL